jgi:hypothetical protein
MIAQELVNKFEEADRKLDGNDIDKLLYWLDEAGIHIKEAWDGFILEQVEREYREERVKEIVKRKEHERVYGKR